MAVVPGPPGLSSRACAYAIAARAYSRDSKPVGVAHRCGEVHHGEHANTRPVRRQGPGPAYPQLATEVFEQCERGRRLEARRAHHVAERRPVRTFAQGALEVDPIACVERPGLARLHAGSAPSGFIGRCRRRLGINAKEQQLSGDISGVQISWLVVITWRRLVPHNAALSGRGASIVSIRSAGVRGWAGECNDPRGQRDPHGAP